MSDLAAYRAFLERKIRLDRGCGFEVPIEEINPALKPHTRAIVQWALRGGRRAIFAAFGLHKTATQIEIMRLIGAREACMRLITLPLGVRQEFRIDAETRFQGKYGVTLKFIRSADEIDDERTIYLTNYESVREGKLDLSLFRALSLDEAAVLRSFGSKTFGEMLFGLAQQVEYRFVATATPDPNEYLELIAYAHFLGVMDMGEAKTRFFKRNSEKADQLTLRAHKEEEFWLWVASWAMFVQRPSDLGFSDDGYVLPDLDVRWHEIPTDHSLAGAEKKSGQRRLFKNAAIGVSDAAREKRDSLPGRIAKLLELRAEDPAAHRIIWHDLEVERLAIEASTTAFSVYGSQDLERREELIIEFRNGVIDELAAKPVMLGAGGNLQLYCAWAIFLGIGFKFNDFIQAVHRLQRFGQTKRVRIDLIHTEAEREVRRTLEEKWARYKHQSDVMAGVIREYGLSHGAMANALTRSMGIGRAEESGNAWRVVNNDCVEETAQMSDASIDLIATSIPFSTQYEYTPSYNDFGHTDTEDHFYEQMDFLSPQLLRVLKPGHVLAVHCKDRVTPGAMTGLGFQTITPFHAEAIRHYRRHGFAYMGMITIVTDVVRENNQTYRLGWTEQCKDGSRMGVGLPEYVLLFRRPPTDSSNGYADERVTKSKEQYSRGRWQFDAHGFWRSSGNRLLSPENLRGMKHAEIFRTFRAHSMQRVYDFEIDVRIADFLDTEGKLPPDFMLLPPQSHHPDVWTDVARMRTLNGSQAAKGREMHLCPLQFDIVDRLITRFSNEGDLVYDPFSGLGTVPLRAVKLGRQGLGVELNPAYHADAVWYLREAERGAETPTLFDLDPVEEAA